MAKSAHDRCGQLGRKATQNTVGQISIGLKLRFVNAYNNILHAVLQSSRRSKLLHTSIGVSEHGQLVEI